MQFLGRGDARDAPRHAVEHARNGFLETLRTALALAGDLLAPRGERFERTLAARSQLDDEIRLFAEARFELLDLAEHLGERRVGALRRVAAADQIQQRLFQ